MKHLIEVEGLDPSATDDNGYTTLQRCALNNRVAAAQYLIDKGAQVMQQDKLGQSSIHWTGVVGAIQMLELIMQNGGSLNARDNQGYTVTHVAAQYDQTKLLHHIVTKFDADVEVRDDNGRTPLHWAAYKNYENAMKILIYLNVQVGHCSTSIKQSS